MQVAKQNKVTKNKAHIFLTLGLLTLFLITPLRVQAYIDLGLAGQLFQAVYLVIIAAIAFVVSPVLFFWKQIKQTIQRLVRRSRDKQGHSRIDNATKNE